MGHPEGVADEGVAQRAECSCQPRVVARLARVVAGVLEHRHPSRNDAVDGTPGLLFPGLAADEPDGCAEPFGEDHGDRLQREAGHPDSAGAAEVGCEDGARATRPEFGDRRERGGDAGVVRDASGCRERDIQVGPEEDALSLERPVPDVIEGAYPGHPGSGGRPGRPSGKHRADIPDQVADPAGVAPLVVVPGEHLHELSVDDGRRVTVHDG